MGATRDIWIAASAISLVLAAQADAAENIKGGVAGYIRPPVTGYPPSGPARRLHIGDAVFHDEKIVTGPGGSAQLIMLDKTTLTLGPNSELTIDEYRYDRAKKEGNMAIRAAKGLFRFVGGFLSKRRPVQVRVPTGTIGIRGAIVTIEMQPDGGVRMTFLYGDQASYDPDGGGEGATINSGGTVLDIAADGSFDIDQIEPEEIEAANSQLQGEAGATVTTLHVSDSDALELLETIQQDEETDQQLNVEILEQKLNLEGAEFEEVREFLEEVTEQNQGGGGYGGGMNIGPQ